MTEYGTIKLPRDAYDRHNERRQDMGLTWEGYVDGEAPAGGVGGDIREQLDRIEEAQGGTVAEALDLADVDPDAIADAVATRGVSLDVGERKAIAEEVVEVLQG